VTRPIVAHPGPPSKVLIGALDDLTKLSQYPVLDAGCGFGRNAIAFASRGLSVVCVDHSRDRLKSLVRSESKNCFDPKHKEGRLYPVLAELKESQWPFSQNCFGAIICVHFLDINLFDVFHASLVPNGHLYIETFGGHGGNYLDLPKAGQLHDLLSRNFNLLFYREKMVGPLGFGAVSVKLLGKKL
jgi:SAM-dependent methyltransferase